MPQLMRVCTILNIPYITPMPLTINNAWFSGFFDTDGTIRAKFDSPSPVIIIAVANKHKIDVEPFLIFNGNICYSKSGYGHYMWSISSQSDINNMLEYFKMNPPRSHKLARVNLVNKFYTLRSLKAHQPLTFSSSLSKSWNSLKTKWSKWE
jgi:hypothetical protein